MIIKLTAAMVLAAGLAGVQPALAQHQGHGTGSAPGIENAPAEAAGVGVIEKVDADKGMVTVTHEPMPEVGWPKMTMDFPVTKRVDLSGVKEGEKVNFKIKLGVDKQYRLTEVAPAQ